MVISKDYVIRKSNILKCGSLRSAMSAVWCIRLCLLTGNKTANEKYAGICAEPSSSDNCPRFIIYPRTAIPICSTASSGLYLLIFSPLVSTLSARSVGELKTNIVSFPSPVFNIVVPTPCQISENNK